jgi:hypothetical protein
MEPREGTGNQGKRNNVQAYRFTVEYVFLDQTQGQCAREHHCGNAKCPLQRFFVGREVPEPARAATETAGADDDQVGT